MKAFFGISMMGLFLAMSVSAEPVDGWTNRPNALRAAERLVEAVELFDESLHAAAAPNQLIAKVHHFEETVAEFTELVRLAPYQQALEELEHIREDVELIRKELYRYPYLFQKKNVWKFWSRLRLDYRYVDHQMYESGPPPTTALKLNGAEYQIVGQGQLKSTETSVQGTGALIFKDPLAFSDNNFTVDFSLEDQGSLALVGAANDQLGGGASLSLTRVGKALKVVLEAGDQKDDLSEEFTQFAADIPLRISVDIHEHGHLIVWVGDAEEQEYSFTPKELGRRWGLSLKGALVTGARADKAKDEHGEEEEHDHDHRG